VTLLPYLQSKKEGIEMNKKMEEKIKESETERWVCNSVLLPAAILALVVNVLSGKTPTIVSVALPALLYWVLFKIGDLVKFAVISTALTFFHRDWFLPSDDEKR